jgi:hypothetical protein
MWIIKSNINSNFNQVLKTVLKWRIEEFSINSTLSLVNKGYIVAAAMVRKAI